MDKRIYDIEEDAEGIVVYDESDDFDPAEGGADETFTDEYMLAFAEKMDAQIVLEKRNDKMISVGVIVGGVAFAAAVTAFFFRNI